jgi:hypothetical protein
VNDRRRPAPSTPAGGPPSAARRVRCRPAVRPASLDAAERHLAERGVSRFPEVSLGPSVHQFRTKADLLRAITHRFTAEVECSRAASIARLDPAAGIRDWLGCLVEPWIDHFARQGTTYFARVCAQAMTDATLRAVVFEEAGFSPSLRRTLAALGTCLPAVPDAVLAQRGEIVSQLIVRLCAEREGAVAAGAPTVWPTWHDLGTGLVDALAGIWTAPCTTGGRPAEQGRRT